MSTRTFPGRLYLFVLLLMFLIPIAARSANLIPNSSFELGDRSEFALKDRRWAGYAKAPSGQIMPPAVVGTAVLGGGASPLQSACFYVPEAGQYTLSLYVRMMNPYLLQVRLARNPVDSMHPSYVLIENITPSTGWQRFSFLCDVQGGTNDLYYVQIYPHNYSDATSFWIDCVQLEKGTTMTTYKPMKTVEFGLRTTRAYNVFEPGEPVALKVQAYNSSSSTSAKLEIIGKDFKNRVVASEFFDMAIAANGLTEKDLSIPVSVYGPVRFELYQQNGAVEDELAVGIMPPVAMEDRGVATQVAQSMNPTFAKYLGLRYGGGDFATWEIVQPTDSSAWNWTSVDSLVDNYTAQGMLFKAVYLHSYSPPPWAKNKANKLRPWPSAENPMFDLDDWDNYVTAVVTHYKGKIDSWTVGNEPFYGDVATYIQLLQSTSAAVKRANPQAEVGGTDCPPTSDDWGKSFASLGGLQYLDFYTSHAYANMGGYFPESLAALKTLSSLDGIQRPVYVSETTDDPWFSYTWYTHLQAANSGSWSGVDGGQYWDWGLTAEEGAARWTKMFVTQLGKGVKYVFPHYNLSGGVLPSTQTRGGAEMDGSWTPYVSAWAVAGKLVSTADSLGEVQGSRNLRLFLFNKRGTPIAAVWTREYEVAQNMYASKAGLFRSQAEANGRRGIVRDIIVPKEHNLRLKLTKGQFTAYDIMGNVIDPVAGDGYCVIPISSDPAYIVGNLISTYTLRQAIASAAVDGFSGQITLPPVNGSNPYTDGDGNAWGVYEVVNCPDHSNFANYSLMTWHPDIFGHFSGATASYHPHRPVQNGAYLQAGASNPSRWGAAYTFTPAVAGTYSLRGTFQCYDPNDPVTRGVTHLYIGKFSSAGVWTCYHSSDMASGAFTPDLSTISSLQYIYLGDGEKLVFVIWSDINRAACLDFSTLMPPGIRLSEGSIKNVGSLAIGSTISIGNKVLYFKQDGFGYIEEPDRSSGIRIEGPISAPEGDSVALSGTVRESSTGERYIQVASMMPNEWTPCGPLGMSNRSAKSRIADGLQVKLWGTVKAGSIGSGSYVISDGSDDEGIEVITATAPAVSDGDLVTVSGAAGYNGTRVLYTH